MLLEVLPKDRSYTVAEACEIVYADPLGCRYKENSIRSEMQSMVAHGALRRVGRRNGHVLWAAADSQVDVDPFGVKSMNEIIVDLP